MGAPTPQLEVVRVGRIGYAAGHALQLARLEERVAGRVPDGLLLLEHDEVVTLGRGTPPEGFGADELAARGVPVVSVERGGEATWHGPGQLVAYPILALPEGRRDLHRYLRELEQVVIDLLLELGLAAERRAGLTGVWVGARKLCSIGVAVRRWVTWHGVSLNVSNELGTFGSFRACGLEPGVMTRVRDHAAVPPGDPLLAGAFERHFRRRFGY